MSTRRRPRPAETTRALPTLEHVAALLAATGLAVAPTLAYVLRDTGCVEASAGGLWSRMEARGVFRSQTAPSGDPWRECPVLLASGYEPTMRSAREQEEPVRSIPPPAPAARHEPVPNTRPPDPQPRGRTIRQRPQHELPARGGYPAVSEFY